MTKVLVISDSHGPLGEDILAYTEDRNEVWHAGDLGFAVGDQINPSILFRAVYGNIDDHLIRRTWPEFNVFDIEGFRVLILHIAGYPGRYNQRARELIETYRPTMVVVGHSHILKIVRDHKYNHWHFNPGACGFKGFHQKRTAIRFTLDQGRLLDTEVIELGDRGRMSSKKN